MSQILHQGLLSDISEIKKAEAQYKDQVQLWEIAQHNTFW